MPTPPHRIAPTRPPADRIILGIDPGTIRTGYGIIHLTGNGLRMLAAGVIQLDKTGLSQPLRLKRIFESVSGLIAEFLPDEMAVEAPFHGENVQSMLKLGRAQGVVMAAAMMRDVPIHEYAPSKVKLAVTGSGRASKEQVAAMLPSLLPELKLAPLSGPADITDALAVALCHYLQGRKLVPTATGNSAKPKAKAGGWAAFVAQNPDRVV